MKTLEQVRAEARKQANQHTNPKAPKCRQAFRSFQEMVEFANTGEGHPNYQSSRSTGYGKEFNDFTNWQEAMKAATCGWPEGSENIRRLTANLNDRVLQQIKLPEPQFHDEGMFLDTERYREGDPECIYRFGDSEESVSGQGEVRILINVCMSCAVDAKILQARGACIAALTNALELAGKRVEVVLVANTSDVYETSFVAKSIEEPVQLDQLAFSVASADVFRRFMFACWERGPKERMEEISYGYGYPKNAHFTEGFDVVLPTMIGYGDKDQWTNPAFAEQWVIAKLKELGVELEEGE